MEKVKVSQEVAKAADVLTTNDTLAEVFNWVTADYEVCNTNIKVLKEWNFQREDEGEGLMKLLIGYYEVEQTPQELLKEYFDGLAESSYGIISSNYSAEQLAIIDALNFLNIKVSGVND